MVILFSVGPCKATSCCLSAERLVPCLLREVRQAAACTWKISSLRSGDQTKVLGYGGHYLIGLKIQHPFALKLHFLKFIQFSTGGSVRYPAVVLVFFQSYGL